LLDISVIYRLMLEFEIMTNIPICTIATTTMTITAYATTITINNNNKFHNIILITTKFLSLFFSQFRRIVRHIRNEMFFIDLQRVGNIA
jgi:hypothetical protein